jgi:hypothetical protein
MENSNLESSTLPSLDKGVVSGSVSFPKGRPKCCGREMYAAGGTLGKIDENSLRYWRCDVCKQEITDLTS